VTPRLQAAAVVVAAAAAALAPGAPAARQPLPTSLTTAESNAEDIVDAAFAHQRSDVRSIAVALETGVRAQGGALREDGVPAALVSELEQRANRLAALARGAPYVQVLLAANAVSQLMPSLYAHFAGPVPPAIQALDYLDREAQFRSLAGQPDRVRAAVKELASTWAHVRPKVVAAGGGGEAAAYDMHVAAMKRLDPAAGARVQSESKRGLELVDRLEGVFG
jgi:hypothetical protein